MGPRGEQIHAEVRVAASSKVAALTEHSDRRVWCDTAAGDLRPARDVYAVVIVTRVPAAAGAFHQDGASAGGDAAAGTGEVDADVAVPAARAASREPSPFRRNGGVVPAKQTPS